MKKFLFLFSMLFIIMIFSNSVKAFEYEKYENVNGEYIDIEREITKEEAIKLIMDKKDMTYNEAVEDLGFNDKSLFSNYNSLRSTSFVERTRRYKNYTSEIEIGGVFEVYSGGSFRSIESCRSMFTRAVSSGFYTWDESYITDITPRYPTQLASLQASGNIEYVISAGLEGTVGKDLLNAGFSIVGTYTYRKTINMNLDYRMY